MEKRYYIKDIEKALNISRKTLFNWERVGKIFKSKRDKMNNYRFWTEEDFKKLIKITGRK